MIINQKYFPPPSSLEGHYLWVQTHRYQITYKIFTMIFNQRMNTVLLNRRLPGLIHISSAQLVALSNWTRKRRPITHTHTHGPGT